MIENGILGEQDPVELIDGEIIEMHARSSAHCCLQTYLLNRFAIPVCAKRVAISVQAPIRFPPSSEPLADLVLLKWRDDRYCSDKPRYDEVLAVVEIADASLGYDLAVKRSLYARAGIPEMWIIDITNRRVHVFRKPEGGAYGDSQVYASGSVSAECIPDFSFSLTEFFPTQQ